MTVAERLARALLEQGLGAAVWPGLIRKSPVRKSALAQAGARPTVEDHYDSFAVADLPMPSERVLLVDDVVTKGRTLLAAAARLEQVFPQAHIRAFALLRTMSLVSEIDSVVQPCVGEIRWCRGDARRCP
ncbi:MAG: phosphoribosyltransferase [Steroidobacterales bacterium]